MYYRGPIFLADFEIIPIEADARFMGDGSGGQGAEVKGFADQLGKVG